MSAVIFYHHIDHDLPAHFTGIHCANYSTCYPHMEDMSLLLKLSLFKISGLNYTYRKGHRSIPCFGFRDMNRFRVHLRHHCCSGVSVQLVALILCIFSAQFVLPLPSSLREEILFTLLFATYVFRCAHDKSSLTLVQQL